MEMIRQFSEFFRHLDVHFQGPWLYLVLSLIIFCETGLVVTPILPGDSLLFAMGALAANEGSALSLPLLLILLTAAAVIGDAVNYAIGYVAGQRVFQSDRSLLFNRKHLLRTQKFYEKYGAKTIILARFVPIVRTFAPFVAGIGRMRYRKFALYNVIGGMAWVSLCLVAGYLFGNVPIVSEHFELVIVAIVLISVMPMAVEFILALRRPTAEVPITADID
ncbi:MAG TPA: DedA family protein [Gemmataceae bacterium]|nr:DedA family protein [Gemmataceae bacterium]